MQQKIKLYIILYAVLAIAALIALAYVVVKVNPETHKIQSLGLFYPALFLFSSSTSALAMFGLRRKFGVREFLTQHFVVSTRQGIWIGLLVCLSFLLQSQRLLSWINTLLLVAALVFLEFFFLTNDLKKEN